MKFDSNWDIEKYHYHYELDNQWKLKKKFLSAHKDKYPENRLICLAQTFCNVHFMGCRYDEPVMELIDELSKGITEKNSKWEKQAFVSASSAVEERVRDKISGPNRPNQKFVNFVQSSNLNSQSQESGRKRPSEKSEDESKAKEAKVDPKEQAVKDDIQFVLESGPFGQMVLFENATNSQGPTSVFDRSVTSAHMVASYSYFVENDETKCKVMVDGLFLATGSGTNQKSSKEAACKVALERLKETSFTVLIKASYVGTEKVDRSLEDQFADHKSANVEKKIDDSNIGSKMMRLMGWSGGGLGKEEQGISEPIKVEESVRRSGLGIKNFSDFRNKVRNLMRNFSKSDTKEDLIFSNDFTKDERKAIHEMVRQFNLKSRSFGKEDERHIVVFKKIRPLEIVQDLLLCGGETSKYKLIPPSSMTERFSTHITN